MLSRLETVLSSTYYQYISRHEFYIIPQIHRHIRIFVHPPDLKVRTTRRELDARHHRRQARVQLVADVGRALRVHRRGRRARGAPQFHEEARCEDGRHAAGGAMSGLAVSVLGDGGRTER